MPLPKSIPPGKGGKPYSAILYQLIASMYIFFFFSSTLYPNLFKIVGLYIFFPFFVYLINL